jgi:hypothetical protein
MNKGGGRDRYVKMMMHYYDNDRYDNYEDWTSHSLPSMKLL